MGGKLITGIDKASLKGCVTANNTTIRVVQGDITKHRSSVIVNSTDDMLNVKGWFHKKLLHIENCGV